VTPVWKFVLNQTSVEVLLGTRQADRQRLLNHFRRLVDDPGRQGDFQAKDEVGRSVQIAVVGKFLVTYWPDHPAHEIRIIDIERI
jgi:hypothetical protein